MNVFRPSFAVRRCALALAVLLVSCAAPPERPPDAVISVEEILSEKELWERGLGFMERAQSLRKGQSTLPSMGGVYGSLEGAEVYNALYAGAVEDFAAILRNYPRSERAPEARYMLGLVNDHPHLNNFGKAMEEYRRTIEDYPGTPAARKASERIKALEAIINGVRP